MGDGEGMMMMLGGDGMMGGMWLARGMRGVVCRLDLAVGGVRGRGMPGEGMMAEEGMAGGDGVMMMPGGYEMMGGTWLEREWVPHMRGAVPRLVEGGVRGRVTPGTGGMAVMEVVVLRAECTMRVRRWLCGIRVSALIWGGRAVG